MSDTKSTSSKRKVGSVQMDKPVVIGTCMDISSIGNMTAIKTLPSEELTGNTNFKATSEVFFEFVEFDDKKGLSLNIITRYRVIANLESNTDDDHRQIVHQGHHHGKYLIECTKSDQSKILKSTYSVSELWPYISVQFWYARRQALLGIMEQSDYYFVDELPVTSLKSVKILKKS